MSYENRIIASQNDNEYRTLKNSEDAIVERVETWVTKGTALFVATTDPAEKAEVLAIRDSLVARLQVVLGV